MRARPVGPVAAGLSAAVVGYQRTISPLMGARCRFEPTCSHYAVEALREHGALRGVRLTVWRLLRCQPFGRPGWDPVPDRPRRADQRTRPGTRRLAARRGARS